MNVQLLLDAVVRQTTVLIAELATAGGARAPLAHIANQVFLDLATELERQGVSRKISADMFGIALRSYQRKVARLRESSTESGRTLWSAVYDFLAERGVATRAEVLLRFAKDDEELVGGVLHDLTESGILFASGRGATSAYRVVTTAELERIHPEDEGSIDAMVWTFVYRDAPVARDDLARRCAIPVDALEASLGRLVEAGRVSKSEGARAVYSSPTLVIPLGATVGWEAAVFDHFQALVRTVVTKLRRAPGDAEQQAFIGGSTYTFVVWPGHPFYEEARRELALSRERGTALRARIDAYNAEHGIPASHQKIIAYHGQCIVAEDDDVAPVEAHLR